VAYASIASPPGANSRTFTVPYVATGVEGTDVTMQIGYTMYDLMYSIVAANSGGTSGDGTQSSGVQVADIPKASRTTTTFRVVFGQQPAAGDAFEFLVSGLVVS
jgi:hypothetical protein